MITNTKNITSDTASSEPSTDNVQNAPTIISDTNEAAACVARSCAATRGTLAANEAPRLVTRGESLDSNPYPGEKYKIVPIGSSGKARVVFIPSQKPDGEPLAAITDYLNTSFPFDPTQENIVQLVRYFTEFLGASFGSLKERKVGLHGYKTSFDIGETGGMLAYGGQRGTALVSLPGSTCSLIGDWRRCIHLFNDILKGRITRWDGAVDMFDGSPSVDDAVAWYLDDRFNTGGNRPLHKVEGDWVQPDGKGRTFNVGVRENGKTLRIYEKGKQLGDKTSPWVRWELELHNQDRIIPWNVLLEPGKYLAGSYGCMGWVNEIQERIRTTRKAASISYEHLTYHAKQAYGPLINIMLEVEGSAEKVIELLQRPGVPSRLAMGGQSPADFICKQCDSETE